MLSASMIRTLKGQNILLFNFYTILLIQLFLNWSLNGCNNNTNIWKFFFLAGLFIRLVEDEFYSNRVISLNLHKILKLVSSIFLFLMAILMISILIGN